MEIALIIKGVSYKAKFTENNKTWGKGLAFVVYDHEGKICYEFSVGTHPEFENFEKYQTMSPTEMAQVVIKRIERGQYVDSIIESAKTGIYLLLRLHPDKSDERD